jgi:hypothetical protein
LDAGGELRGARVQVEGASGGDEWKVSGGRGFYGSESAVLPRGTWRVQGRRWCERQGRVSGSVKVLAAGGEALYFTVDVQAAP